MASLGMGRVTSASTRNVTVAHQSITCTVMVRPGLGVAPVSIRVNGHGPAMQETRAFSNRCPTPASMVIPPWEAFHLPSCEQGGLSPQGTFPMFVTVDVLAVLPTLTAVDVCSAYRMRTSLTKISGMREAGTTGAGTGVIRTTNSSPFIFGVIWAG